MLAARLQSPQLDGFRGPARPPARAYSPLFHPAINLLPNPHAAPLPHLPPYFNPPPFSARPNLDGYLNVSPPYVPAYANPDASSNPYTKYLPYAGEGMDLGQMNVNVNGNKQLGGVGAGARGVRDGQGPWGKPDKVTPAAQLMREHSGLTLASSGGSGTLNNPVHKVPKVHHLTTVCVCTCVCVRHLALEK